jgi:hypothetical protein
MDRIFTRIGAGDSIEANASSFMVEMQVGGGWARLGGASMPRSMGGGI